MRGTRGSSLIRVSRLEQAWRSIHSMDAMRLIPSSGRKPSIPCASLCAHLISCHSIEWIPCLFGRPTEGPALAFPARPEWCTHPVAQAVPCKSAQHLQPGAEGNRRKRPSCPLGDRHVLVCQTPCTYTGHAVPGGVGVADCLSFSGTTGGAPPAPGTRELDTGDACCRGSLVYESMKTQSRAC